MLILTTDQAPGYEIERVYGLITASARYTKVSMGQSGRTIKDAFRRVDIVPDQDFEELLDEARQNLVEKAFNDGANAILGMRIGSPTYDSLMTQAVIVYGTAARVREIF